MAKRLRPGQKWFKAMFYGLPGATKTRTAATAAFDERTAPVLHFDIGGNTESIDDYRRQPDRVLIEAPKELNPFYNWLKDGQPTTGQWARLISQFELRPPYKTVVIDGVTGFQRGMFRIITGETELELAAIPKKLERGHYGQVLAAMTNFSMLFFRLEMHVIVTALERQQLVGAGDDAYMYVSPLLLGQSATEVAGDARAVARMLHIERLSPVDRKDIKRAVEAGAKSRGAAEAVELVSVADFRQTMHQYGKDQLGIRPPGGRMVNPTITKMLDLMEVHLAAIEDGSGLVDGEGAASEEVTE